MVVLGPVVSDKHACHAVLLASDGGGGRDDAIRDAGRTPATVRPLVGDDWASQNAGGGRALGAVLRYLAPPETEDVLRCSYASPNGTWWALRTSPAMRAPSRRWREHFRLRFAPPSGLLCGAVAVCLRSITVRSQMPSRPGVRSPMTLGSADGEGTRKGLEAPEAE